MKRIVEILLFSALLISIVVFIPQNHNAIINMIMSSESKEMLKESVKINTVETNINTDYMKTKLRIPVIEGMKNINIQSKINDEFEKIVLNFKNKIETNTDTFDKEYNKSDNIKTRYEYETAYAVTFNKNSILSIVMDFYYRIEGAKSSISRTAYNYDLGTGKQIYLNDIFKKGIRYKEIIKSEISKIKSSSEKNAPYAGIFQTISVTQPFYIKGDGIVIFIGLHSTTEMPEFFIPYSLFKDGVKTRFIDYNS